ncbi:MAG: glycosyltransferase family 4 protein [Verrucomicrobiota bacterium]
MKVCLLTNMIPPYRVPFFEALAGHCDLHVICDTLTESNRQWEIPDSFPFPVTILNSKNVHWTLNQQDLDYKERRQFHFGWKVSKELNRRKPDIVVTCEFGLRTILAARHCGRHHLPLGIWWEGTKHTERNVTGIRRWVRRWLAPKASFYWSNGKASTEYVKSLGDIQASFHEGITGVDTAKLAADCDEELRGRDALRESMGLKGTVFLFAGALNGRKGVREFCAALRELDGKLDGRECSFVFVGDGECREDLEEVAKATSNNLIVKLEGFRQPEELTRYFALADAFVLPTLEDNWPLVTIEAVAAGLPQLLSTYNGAAQNLGENPELGRVFDPVKTPDFASMLLDWCVTPPPRIPETLRQEKIRYYSPSSQAERAFQAMVNTGKDTEA